MSSHLKKIKTQPHNLKHYQNLTPEIVEECFLLSQKIKGLKVLHINSTESGGGVAEMLKTQIPLEKSLGIDSQWWVIRAPEKFFKVTKKIHNLLQGKSEKLSQSEKNIYLNWLSDRIGADLQNLIRQEKPQIIIIHDPQPLPLIDFIPLNIFSILRIHLDLSTPNKSTLDFLRPWMEKYQLGIFTHPAYRPKWWPIKKSKFITPAIDPFTDKNKLMSLPQARKIINSFQINTNQPIISQISRFDPWKDQFSTIKSYYLAKNKIPSLNLILTGFCHINDDPEAKRIFEKIKKETINNPHIFLISDPDDLSINAIYTASQIIIQKSIREGFGMVITEAMWKRKPVIGGKTLGIKMQIENGKNGFLVSDAQEIAEKVILLLKNPSLQKKIGQAAQQTVKEKFLFSRLILNHLKIYTALPPT